MQKDRIQKTGDRIQEIPCFGPNSCLLYSIPSNSLKKELLFALINLVAITGLRDYP
jgi:hypothetical protein